METKKVWERKLIKKLIELWKENELLYNQNHPDYINNVKRKEAFESIFNEVKNLDKDLTLQGMKNKMQTLRKQYNWVHKLVQNAKLNGKVYVPKLYYYHSLNFLKPYTILATQPTADVEEDEGSLSNHSDTSEKSNKQFWRTDTVEKLIALYKKNPHLYNTNHPDHKDFRKREATYKMITKELQNLDNDLTIWKIKNKFQYLRGQYIAAHRRVQEAKQKGRVYKPSQWFYESMGFLEDCIKPATLSQDINFVNVAEFDSQHAADDSNASNLSTNSMETEDELNRNPFSPMQEDDEEEEEKETADVAVENSFSNDEALVGESAAFENSNVERQYEWLGEQIIYEINKIQSENLQGETAWAIQMILRENLLKDKALRSKNNK